MFKRKRIASPTTKSAGEQNHAHCRICKRTVFLDIEHFWVETNACNYCNGLVASLRQKLNSIVYGVRDKERLIEVLNILHTLSIPYANCTKETIEYPLYGLDHIISIVPYKCETTEQHTKPCCYTCELKRPISPYWTSNGSDGIYGQTL